MILRPRFLSARYSDPLAIRKELGPPNSPATGMLLFGGFGSKVMLEIVGNWTAARLPLQLIVISGVMRSWRKHFAAQMELCRSTLVGFTKECTG